MIETGQVVAVEPEAIWVETLRRSTCGACVAKAGCGQGILNSMGQGHRHHIRVDISKLNPRPSVGDEVTLAINEQMLTIAALWAYLMPLLALLLGMILGEHWGGSDGAAAIGALVGMLSGIAVLYWHGKRSLTNPDYQPRVISVSKSAVSLSVPPVELI